MAGTVVAVGATLLAATGPAQAIDAGKTGPLDARGFPTSYTDDAGLSLVICEDGSANCAGATTADLANTTDGENFYWSADATLNSPRGSLQVIMAHEAAFASPNVPTVFDRLRVRGHLSRAGTYTLLTPYGKKTFEAGPVADQRNVFDTEDLGCALSPGTVCGGHITNWLRSTSAPAGYLGNASTATTVTGGTVRNEVVLLAPDGSVLARTKRFIIEGKLAPGPQTALSTSAVDLGNTKKASKRSVVVSNLGDAALSFSGIRVLGAKQVKVAPGGCGASLAAGASCRVNLVYRPGAQRSVAGTLVVNDNSVAGVHRVPVKASTTAIASSQRRVRFSALKVGSSSHTRRVVVTNKGVVPLKIKGVSLAGRAAKSFQRRSGQGPLCAKGTRVRPGATCALYLGFAPKTFGAKTAALVVRTNAAAGAHRIVLNGRGR